MIDLYYLTKNEFLKIFRLFYSYKLNLVFQTIISLIGLGIVILGVKKIFGNPEGFYSVLLIPTIGNAISSLGNAYKFDNLIGVTEQIFTSYISIFKINIARYLINYLLSIVPSVLLVFISYMFFEFTINNYYLIISFILIGVICYYISLTLWSVSLLFRDIDSLNTILNIIIVGSLLSVVFLDDNYLWIFQFIPFSCIIIISTLPFEIFDLSLQLYILTTMNYILSIIICIITTNKLYILSKKKGTIGMY
ncbi:hypothetical protein PGM86_12205 [Staphylococcus pseudintermedius]|uniref:hypothetical protein n=1 Tax=Staphylococcus pseudintermedius TaxID=283734 RepID=UPI0018F758E7|nr:hypothetical protein [Staphylococcus pseudintermedius]EIQ3872082.1 hypothetical protein [Staphylococcus pseudintermedius]EJA1900642.1 hypothetical protein [Staphylococcus pseudintermedius]EKO0830902.1 hypothetical protein [Staphylococcus pseudintermedius]MBJ8282142.1 hypothetical protein [Staphylococcus pseudintermedius]MDK3605892.1 hypothetical protein [Staphylococcus pseudintermedius]